MNRRDFLKLITAAPFVGIATPETAAPFSRARVEKLQKAEVAQRFKVGDWVGEVREGLPPIVHRVIAVNDDDSCVCDINGKTLRGSELERALNVQQAVVASPDYNKPNDQFLADAKGDLNFWLEWRVGQYQPIIEENKHWSEWEEVVNGQSRPCVRLTYWFI